MKFKTYKFLLFFCSNLLFQESVISQTISEGDGYLEYGIGRFEYESSAWSITSASVISYLEDSFMLTLTSTEPYSAQSISATFSKYSYNAPTLEDSVTDAYESNVQNPGAENVQYEYFETSNGYPAGISYYETTISGITSTIGQLWVDLTETSDADSVVLFSGILTLSTIQEIKSAANGVTNTGTGLPNPQQSVNELLSLPILEPVQTISEGDGYLEYGIGRFEYESSAWSITSASVISYLEDSFMLTLTSTEPYSAQSISATFSKYSYNAPTLEDSVTDAYESNVQNPGAENVQYEYFETSNGYPAGISYYETTISGITSAIGQLWVDLTETSDADSVVLFSGILTLSTIQEIKSAANGVKRYQGTPIVSDPNDDTGNSDEEDSNEGNSDEPENTIPLEDTLVCDFQDGPISICFPENTLIDIYQSYSEDLILTQAQYLPGLNSSKFPSFIINSLTESNHAKLEDWAAHKVASWELSELNASVTTNRFQTKNGFPGIYITRKYSGLMGPNSFDYMIAIDLSTDPWRQRHRQKQHAQDSDWFKVQLEGTNASTNENDFPTTLAVAKSLDYNSSYSPAAKSYSEIGQVSPASFSNPRLFSDGPLSFECPENTLIDIYQSYSEDLILTQAQYWPGLNGSKFPSFIINSLTESNHAKLEDWAAHKVASWELSELNASVTTNRFQTKNGFPGIYITRKYSGMMGPDSFDYMIAIDLSTDPWRQRHRQKQHAQDSDWFKVQLEGTNASSNKDEFPTALAVAKSLDYNSSYSPAAKSYSETPVTSIIATSTSGNVMSKWVESGWLGVFFEASNGWIYHPDLGWMYAENSSGDKTWLYSDKKGWLWTSKDAYPYLYSDNSSNWVYVVSDQDAPTKAFDYNPKKWTLWQDLTLMKMVQPGPNKLSTSTADEKKVYEIINSNASDKDKLNRIAEAVRSKL